MLDLRLLFVAVAWGANFVIVKFALDDFAPLSFTLARFALAALFLLAVMAGNRESFAVEPRDRGAMVRLGFIGITLYNILFMEGLLYTTASHSALFISMSPLFAALIQSLSGRERITGRVGTGLLLASLGAALVIRGRYGGIGLDAKGLLGDLMTIGASVLWALYTMKAKPLLEKYSPIKVSAYSMAAGTILLLPAGICEMVRRSGTTAVSTLSWAALAFAAFIAGGVAYSLWYRGVKEAGVTRTIIYHYIVPLVAVVFAALLLGERITIGQVVGGISILAGVAVVQKNRDA